MDRADKTIRRSKNINYIEVRVVVTSGGGRG